MRGFHCGAMDEVCYIHVGYINDIIGFVASVLLQFVASVLLYQYKPDN